MELNASDVNIKLQECISKTENLKLQLQKKDLRIQELKANHERTALRHEKQLLKKDAEIKELKKQLASEIEKFKSMMNSVAYVANFNKHKK